MREPLWQIWKYAFLETVRRMFGHQYGCCAKWWKRCRRCEKWET